MLGVEQAELLTSSLGKHLILDLFIALSILVLQGSIYFCLFSCLETPHDFPFQINSNKPYIILSIVICTSDLDYKGHVI